jgi:hypothetical protein
MKTKTRDAILFTFTLALLFLSPSCTSIQIDPEQELIKRYKPQHHNECLTYGRYGEYSYNVYSKSVEIIALSADIAVLHADVFDTDGDGVFDSVWVMQKGVWKFHSSKKHPVLANTADTSTHLGFIGLANLVRKKSNTRSKLSWDF